jgi:MFS family permease
MATGGVSTKTIVNDSTSLYSVRNDYKGWQFTEVLTETKTAAGAVAGVTSFKDIRVDGPTYREFILLVFVQILFVTMVYGPIAAFLVELFPTKIRYTSMSLPYHIGNGIFGGLTPFIATLLTTRFTGDKLVGLWYPMIIAALCLVIGTLYVSNRIDPNVND